MSWLRRVSCQLRRLEGGCLWFWHRAQWAMCTMCSLTDIWIWIGQTPDFVDWIQFSFQECRTAVKGDKEWCANSQGSDNEHGVLSNLWKLVHNGVSKRANILNLEENILLFTETFVLLQCSFVEHRNYKVIYRRYASLFFLVGVDGDEVRFCNIQFSLVPILVIITPCHSHQLVWNQSDVSM